MNTDERKQLAERLEELSQISLMETGLEDAALITDVRIDRKQKPEERVLSLIGQSSNPYLYREGSMVVKISFANNGKTMQSCMEDYLESELLHRENKSHI